MRSLALRPLSIAAALAWCAMAAGVNSAQAQVYRCGNSYSQQPCQGGKTVDVTAPVQVEATGGPHTVLYLCRSYGGSQFWTRESCAQRDALVERMETVPARLDFEQQVQIAQGQLARSQMEAAAPAQAQATAATPAEDPRAACAWLDERIRQLDRMARAGGSARKMDWIAHERKQARDQQFRTRC